MSFKDLKKRFEKHKTLSQKLKSDQDNAITEKKEKEKEKANLVSQKGKVQKSKEITKQLVEIIFERNISEFKGLQNEGLKQIFWDQDYEFDVEIDNRGHNKTCKFLYREKDEEGNWTGWRDLDTGSGGAVRSVIDTIARIFLIIKSNRKRVLFLDESFTEISDQYIDQFVSFLKQLNDRLGFKILMVSHDQRWIDQADHIYEMEEGRTEKIK